VTISATVAVPARAPAPAAVPAVAPAVAQQVDVLASLQKLALGIRAKLDAAKTPPTLQDFTAELAAFDAIVADNKDAKPDDLAQVLAVKASLFVQVFNDYDSAAKAIAQIKADYPQTEIGTHVDEMLADLRRMQAKYLAKQALATGNVFPDFSAKSITGQDVSLARLKGKVVLVDFWATWCPPCVADLPRLKAAYEKYHDKGFEIVGISLDKSESALKDFIKAREIPWAQIFDGKGWESPLAEKYGVDMIPTMYLLDADGKIVGSNLSGMVLEEQLEKLLGK
jgi:peroxiredoxin